MSRWDYKGMVVQEHALVEALLLMEGKGPLKANKLLKAAAAWKDSTHLLSTFRFQALTTHINSFNAHNNPHEMCPITTHSRHIENHGTPALHQSAHRSLKRTRYNYLVNFYQRTWGFWSLEGEGCNHKRGNFKHFKWKHRKYEGCWGGTNVEQQVIILG